MNFNASSLHSLRRVFQEGFTVNDIAEPLVSFDDWSPAERVRKLMIENSYQVVGVRCGGRVDGFLELSHLGEGSCKDYRQAFDDRQVIGNSETFAELVIQLKDYQRLFVSILGNVGAIVSRSDLQKPPVRMWLFGMLTLIEMRFTRIIEQFCGNDQWKPFLSQGRIDKAEKLLAERKRRNQELRLLDCIQLSDKTQIVARNESLRKLTRFESRNQLDDAAKRLEKLRNNLAHTQDIITNDWDTIVALTESIDAVLEGPPGLRSQEPEEA